MLSDALLRVLLLCLLALPAAAAAVVGLLGPRRLAPIRWLSLAASVGTLVLALVLAWQLCVRRAESAAPRPAGMFPTFYPEFVPGAPGESGNRHATSWTLLRIGPGAVQFYIGLDGLNVWLVVLTAVLMLPSVLVSWEAITERVNEFYAWLLLLQTVMMGIFLSFDIVLFYVFFEASLVPLFFLIGIWGGPARRHAAGKFFIYTLTGSLISLLGILGIVLACQPESGGELTFSIPRLVQLIHERLVVSSSAKYFGSVQFWVFLALTAGFAVKVPLMPFHTWLPLAHTEAPTAGSVDLAGVLLKVGAYGFLRLCLPLAPDVSLTLGMPLISVLAAAGIVYGALCAFAQDDIKRLIAYSSVSHLGLIMLAMFSMTPAGIDGSVVQMINHGLSTGALFLLIGMLYDRYHTRKLSDYGGMAGRLPVLACFMVFMCLSSAGLPGLNGFVGEYLSLSGVMDRDMAKGGLPVYATVAASGVLLGALYLFTMLWRVFFGPLKEPAAHEPGHAPVTDLKVREWALLVPLAILCVAIGIYPQPILATTRRDADTLADIAQRARVRAAIAAEGSSQAAADGPSKEATP